MAQIPTSLYQNLATSYNDAREQMVGADQYLLDALNYVVNVTTSVPGGAEIELALLGSVNASYRMLGDVLSSTSSMIQACIAINSYVIANMTAADAVLATAAGVDKLTYYVNNQCSWSCVPYYWEEISSDAGYDTARWKVCS